MPPGRLAHAQAVQQDASLAGRGVASHHGPPSFPNTAETALGAGSHRPLHHGGRYRNRDLDHPQALDKLPGCVTSPLRDRPSDLRAAGSDATEDPVRLLRAPTRMDDRRGCRRGRRPPTVAHDHLERLVSRGYLSLSQRRGTTGKPAKLYRLTERQIDVSYPIRRFARLAALLAQAVRGTTDGVAAAREAGRVRRLDGTRSRRTHPSRVLRDSTPGGRVRGVQLATSWPATAIFRRACEQAQDIVWELHAGILEGAFRKAGLEDLGPCYRGLTTAGLHLGSFAFVDGDTEGHPLQPSARGSPPLLSAHDAISRRPLPIPALVTARSSSSTKRGTNKMAEPSVRPIGGVFAIPRWYTLSAMRSSRTRSSAKDRRTPSFVSGIPTSWTGSRG